MIRKLKMIANNILLKIKYGILTDIYRGIYKRKNRKTVSYVPVLAFHWFLTEEEKNSVAYKDNKWYASIQRFEEQLQWLKEHNYHTLTGDEFSEWIYGTKELTGKPVLLTFDDGELSQLQLVMPLLHQYGFHGICFVIGKHFVGDTAATVPSEASEDSVTFFTREQFEESPFKDSAMEIGSHTYNLHYLMQGVSAARSVSYEEMEKDLEQMHRLSLNYAAMPYGKYGENTEILLKDYYKLCFAIDRFGNPYARRTSSLYAINRILVDGNAEGDFLKRNLY